MAANQAGRLIRLEDRIPKGCPTCRKWGPCAYQVNDNAPERPEHCPVCGRHVPILLIRHILLPDGLWEAV